MANENQIPKSHSAAVRPILNIGCIGEVMIEIIAGQGNAALLNVAGDTYNTAVYLRRALKSPAISVSYITVLGQDAFSDRIFRHAETNGLSTETISRHPTRTPGLYAIETDGRGERHFTYWRSNSAARTLFDQDGRDPESVLRGLDLVLLSGITLAILSPLGRSKLYPALDDFRASGGQVAFDSNYRAHLWESPETARCETTKMWWRTDIALPSFEDEMIMFGDQSEDKLLDRFRDFGVTSGALKRGEYGPRDLGPSGSVCTVVPVENVIDTTAAGDSFNAGYLAALVNAETPQAAMLAGHTLASKVISRPGAIVDFDDWP